MAAVAARQHGVVTHRQLVAAGYSAAAIQRRVENGHLHRKYKGVYAVGYSVLSTRGCWMAAVLASGADALLSHRDAAELWELRRNGRRSVDVTSPRSRHEHDGITLHRSRHIHPDDRAEVDGIPVTSVARTLLDFADVASQQQVERLVEQAELRELFDLRAVDALIARSNGRRGVARLERAIAGARPFVPFTRSELEDTFSSVCWDAGLRPSMNVWVAGHEVDALFEDALVVEIDGAAVHGTRQAGRRDPLREAALQIAGYRFLRVGEEWLRNDPAGVARTIRAMLAPYFKNPS